MKCQVCNADATAGATFCQHCGAKLPARDAGAESPKSPSAVPAQAAQQPIATTAAATSPAAAATAGRRRGVDVPEETLWEGSYSPKAMLGPAIGCGVVTIALLVLGGMYDGWIWALPLILLPWLLLLFRLAWLRLGVSYKLTNQMFYHRSGVLTRTTNRIEAIDIDDVTWTQGLFERLVNVGTVTISSSDRTDPRLPISGIENVEEVAGMIDKARRGRTNPTRAEHRITVDAGGHVVIAASSLQFRFSVGV